MNDVNFRVFTQDDWAGFCGATPFDHHTPPRLAHVGTEAYECAVVLGRLEDTDAWTATVIFYEANGGESDYEDLMDESFELCIPSTWFTVSQFERKVTELLKEFHEHSHQEASYLLDRGFKQI